MMTIRRLALGAALGVALAVGFWATAPADEAVEAGGLGSMGPTFDCAVSRADAAFLITRVNRTLGEALVLLGQGFSCIPTAADQASPRFRCTLAGVQFGDSRFLSQATAIIRVGGSCLPNGLPPLPAP